MTEEELTEKIENVKKKKTAFIRNRNICCIATALLVYNFYSTIREESPPVWFLFAMGAIILICGCIGFYGHQSVKKLDTELAVLHKELQVNNEDDSVGK